MVLNLNLKVFLNSILLIWILYYNHIICFKQNFTGSEMNDDWLQILKKRNLVFATTSNFITQLYICNLVVIWLFDLTEFIV